MEKPSGIMIGRLQVLQRSTTYTGDLCAAVILGSATNRHNAMNLLPHALSVLHARVCEAMQAMEGQPAVPVKGGERCMDG
jgi:hypothetical protein